MTAPAALAPARIAGFGLAAALATALLLGMATGAGPVQAAAGPAELAAPDAAAAEASIVYLKGDVTVEGPMVTLGDLLVGVPERVAEVPVARAPEPGDRGRVRTSAVLRAAKLHGVDWQPFAESRSILVTRAGMPVEQADLSQAILHALQPQLGEGDYDLYLNTRGRETYVATDAIIDVVVEHIDYRRDSGRFNASVRITDDPGTQPLRVTGQVTEMTQLPVLRGRKENGDIIGAEDITYRKVRADRIPANVLTEAQDLIGRTPRRAIPAGHNVRENDVIVPQDVKRNEMVTMVVNHGGMMLTSTGQALESGARGAVIGVRNLHSKRVVRGTVVGPGEVHMLINHNIVTQGRIASQAHAPGRAVN